MKRMFFFSLMVFFASMANATVDCTPMGLISATNTEMTISLATSPSCDDETHVISMRVSGIGAGWTVMPATITSPAFGAYEAVITGLEPCTEYDVMIEVFCDGMIEGGCVTYRPYETACDPCDGCFNYFGVEVVDSRECEFELVMDYAGSGECGAITIVSETWDFGDGTAGTGYYTTHTFPGNGTYTVTGTIVYSVAGLEGECTVVQSAEVTVTDCISCEDCFNFFGVEVVDSEECEFELVMDYAASGDCGAITIVSETWDFGDGTSGSGYYTTHTFPGNGTYTVTGTIVYTAADFEGECTAVQSAEVTVTDCLSCEDCFNFFGVEVVDSRECEFELVMDYAASGECGAITIVSETWDFGDGTTGSGYYTTHTFPGNGTYTVTGTIVYTSADLEGECTAVQSAEVTVTDCLSCEDCFNFFGIELLSRSGCTASLVMDYAASGDCGAISIVSEIWNFGDGTTGSGYWTSHTFPGSGIYIVTATITYTTAELEGECTATLSRKVWVGDCKDEISDSKKSVNSTGGISNNVSLTTVPNPASDNVTITLLDPNTSIESDQLTVIIYDMNGREVYRSTIVAGSPKTIDVSQFNTGVYLYQVTDGAAIMLREKLVIQ